MSELLDAVRADIDVALGVAAVKPSAAGPIAPKLQLAVSREITERLVEVGIRPFLMSGTLLGYVREGSFMEHDYDIDLGLMPGDDLAVAIAAMSKVPGYEVFIEGPPGWWCTTRDYEPICSHTSCATACSGTPPSSTNGGTRRSNWSRSNSMACDCGCRLTPRRISTRTIGTGRSRSRSTGWLRHAESCVSIDPCGDSPPPPLLHSRLQTGDRWIVESAARELRDSFGIDVTTHLARSPLLGITDDRSLGIERSTP